MVNELSELDLDAARAARSATSGRPIPLRFGGRIICELPPELPVDVLEPLTSLKINTTMLVSRALEAFKSGSAQQTGLILLDTLIDLMLDNPNLPAELLDAVRAMGQRLMGEAGYQAFVAARPSIGDVVALIKGLRGRYAIRLGEETPSLKTSPDGSTSSTPSPGDSPSGETSTPTSSTTTTASTSPASGSAPESLASSPPADSSTSPLASHPAPVSTPPSSSEPTPGTTFESSSPS